MLKVINPATGALIVELKTDTEISIREKYETAVKAQKLWATTPVEHRLECIRKFRSALVDRMESLALKLTEEVGKPVQQSRNEIKGLLGRIDFFLEKAASTLKDDQVLKEKDLEEVIRQEPLGVIVNISAWNYPYFVGGNVFVPALLTGNAILYKPSEFSSLTGLAIEEMLHQAGIPKGCFATVIGTGEQGAALLKLPINGVFFTGSYATGAKIAEAASRKMIKMQLELGGKDPVYVCEDVDVASVAAGVADGAFYNTGQSCCSVERIYVHEKIYSQFVEEFVKTTQSFELGDPKKDSTYIGAITRSAQIDVLEAQVKDAVGKGARVVLGGHRIRGAGNYFEPTVLTEVNHSMQVMREESFGPIIGIQKVSSDAEALELMNDTDYGLTAAVYTKDRERASKILAQVNSGSVYWNCCDRVSPRLPWSGRKHSGIGVTLSTLGIETFLQPKAWHLRG
ncbi:MAG: aldehyde dehydrogenase family protein [Candidatus Melainabacteria bacterium]|nr:aldehyde dehydrogenase family protein [Candidatus Melainabacteria bacterium]